MCKLIFSIAFFLATEIVGTSLVQDFPLILSRLAACLYQIDHIECALWDRREYQ